VTASERKQYEELLIGFDSDIAESEAHLRKCAGMPADLLQELRAKVAEAKEWRARVARQIAKDDEERERKANSGLSGLWRRIATRG
jgi:hypothetical protein